MKDTTKPTPSLDDLRKFAFIVGGVLAVIFGGLIPYLNRGSWNPNLVYIGSAIIFLGVTVPKILLYPYKLWMLIGEVLGWINTRIILSVIFFLLFTPIGIIKKIFGNDSMRRKLDSKTETYRIVCIERTSDHMERPF
ncbi:MAG: SxtJ family membrane protein [Leptospira sp.]|nr:SxtJ family membrane protein [Leptospira sp.]